MDTVGGATNTKEAQSSILHLVQLFLGGGIIYIIG